MKLEDEIKARLKKIGHGDLDPRHIEAFMRLEHPTLNGLTRRQFNKEVAISAQCVVEVGTESAEETAKSFGL